MIHGIGVATALTLALSAMSAAAQVDDAVAIDEIQVTATRRPADASEISAALTLISGDEIAANKLTTDALANRPGVFLQQTTPGQGAAIIRGLKGSEILHIVDGFRLNNAIFRNAPTQYLALVAPGTIDRIEVLRGAPTSLYGSDAVGGVVQVLSRVPRFDTPENGIRRDLQAAFDTAELGRSLRGAVDFGNRRVAALVAAGYLETGDRMTGAGERIGPSGYSSRDARVALSLTPDEQRSWLFDLQYAKQPSTPRVDELVPGFGQTEPSSSEFLFAPNERWFAHVQHVFSDGWWSADWAVDAGWQRIVDDRVSRDFQADARRREQNTSDLAGVTVSVAKDGGMRSWIAGAELYHDRVSSRRIEEDVNSGLQQSVQSRFPDGATARQAAVFGELTSHLGDRNTLTVGLRFSAVRVELPATAISPAAVVDPDDLSGDLGWVFDVADGWQLVANLSSGFRAPNVFDLGTLGPRPGNRFNIPNPGLGSERATQLDLGVKHRGRRWDAQLFVFGLRYSDRITSVLTGDATPEGRDVVQSRNVAEADILGVEAMANWSLTDSLSTQAILNVTRGEQRDDDTTVPGDRIPPLNGRVNLLYAANERLSIDTSVLFAGAQDRLSPRDVRDVRIDPDGTAGWATLNVRGTWQPRRHWTVTVGVENLFDKQYRVHGSGIDAPGRNLKLGAQVTW